MPTVLSSQELTPYASDMSLFLRDRESSSEVDYSGWHHPDVALRRVRVTPFELHIATARYDVVPVRLRVLAQSPLPDLAASHVVEADLRIPSGKLILHSVTDIWDEVPDIPVTPGRYRVRVTYQARDEQTPGSDVNAPGDHFDYLIDLWSTRAAREPETIVNGPEVWAG